MPLRAEGGGPARVTAAVGAGGQDGPAAEKSDDIRLDGEEGGCWDGRREGDVHRACGERWELAQGPATRAGRPSSAQQRRAQAAFTSLQQQASASALSPQSCKGIRPGRTQKQERSLLETTILQGLS